MSEEFVSDIIGATEPTTDVVPKTESEMIADITGGNIETPVKEEAVTEPKDEKGSEATPDIKADVDSKSTDEGDLKSSADVKALATQLGWREDHTGEDSVDAATYILKSKDIQKSMSQHNKDLKDKLHALDISVDALRKHNESVYQAEVKKLQNEVLELKKERKSAIELADVDKVEELDQQIDEKQKDINKPKPKDDSSDKIVNPIYDEWIQDNDWYLKDDDMAKYADTVAGQYAGAPLDRIYKIVTDKVKEVFPDKFDSPPAEVKENKSPEVKTPIGPKSPVESSSAKGNDATFTKDDLTPDQVQIMNQFVRGGIMTEDQYIKDISKLQ